MHIDLYKIDKTDVFICERELQGEGQWVNYFQYMDNKGSEYQVWVSQDGDEKVVELK